MVEQEIFQKPYQVLSFDGSTGVVDMKAEGPQAGQCDGAAFQNQDISFASQFCGLPCHCVCALSLPPPPPRLTRSRRGANRPPQHPQHMNPPKRQDNAVTIENEADCGLGSAEYSVRYCPDQDQFVVNIVKPWTVQVALSSQACSTPAAGGEV